MAFNSRLFFESYISEQIFIYRFYLDKSRYEEQDLDSKICRIQGLDFSSFFFFFK